MGTNSKGLTLSEVIVALGILAVVSLAVIGFFSSILASGEKQANQGIARRLAEKVLTRATREGPPGWGMEGQRKGEIQLSAQRTDSTTTFYYQLEIDELKPESASVAPLKRVEVVVSWWPETTDQNHGRRGQGKLSVTADQVVYLGK